MRVQLINAEEASNFFENWGKTSSVCYDSVMDDYSKVGKHCLKAGHFSGSRNFYFTFKIEDISRACTAQLNRHEVGVMKNERSLRYCKPNGVYIPDVVSQNEDLKQEYNEAMTYMFSLYDYFNNWLLSSGCTAEQANETARYLLPMATLSSGVWGFTLEALINFSHKRLCNRAQEEIRQLAQEMVKQVVSILPELKPYLVPSCVALGKCPEIKSCKKA